MLLHDRPRIGSLALVACWWLAVISPAALAVDTGIQSPDGVIGFAAASPAPSATWEYKPTRWGKYDIEAVVSDAAPDAEVQVEFAGESIVAKVADGSPRGGDVVVAVGRRYLAKADPFALRASARKGSLTVKSVTLRPAPEGDPIVALPTGEILLRARDGTTHSVTMRYEPAAIKNCMGYWVNPADWADWQFATKRAGTYEIEVWQGCGKGQGGSDVAVDVGGKRFEFKVEETGHFQSFLPRALGRVRLEAGPQVLAIRPQRKQAGAVMDIRQIRLVPVDATAGASDEAKAVIGARRVLVVGDSITYGGEWVEFAETWMRLQYPYSEFELINIGLPSETVSGLSEEGHAGGSFPRPDVHERLGRALEQVRPDVVIVCYGMNDGIYFPYSEERADRFRKGMTRLHGRAVEAGARVIHLTPPMFDALPLAGRTLPEGRDRYPSPYEGYDDVLARYAEWLLGQKERGWEVVDIHGPMRRFVDGKRGDQPRFTVAGDGVHPNSQGHWLMARELLRYLGAPPALVDAESAEALKSMHPRAGEVLRLVQQRQRMLKDSWMTTIGHRRPGMAKGRPMEEATREAVGLAARIHEEADLQFPGRRSLWNGFERFDFAVAGKPVLVVAPKVAAPGRPWVWHGEFFGHKPDPDIALLGRGFHVVYLSVPNLLGAPAAVESWNALYRELTTRHGLGPKPGLVGLSRGGLYVYNWATANPDKVACIYGDAPVCDFKSWPGGKGKGPGSAGDWKLVLERYGFKSEAEALAYGGNPVDKLAVLADARVPLLHVYGDADEVVPWDENTGVVAKRYRELGGEITLIAKPGVKHHPHGLVDPTPIVEFFARNAAGPGAREWLARHGGGPVDAAGKPLIRKLGTVDVDLVETTPIVFAGRSWRFEWVRAQYWDNKRGTNWFRFRDPATGETTPPFADGHEFGSAFVHDGTVYVTGTLRPGRVDVFASRDLKTWETWTAIAPGRYSVFNTSVCKAGDEFVLMFEIDKPAEEAGVAFTARFAKSPDLRTWTVTPPECNYAKDRYTAPHCLRWSAGWFYDFYLEAHDGYEMRVVRSKDLARWEPSPLNPVLKASPHDKVIANPRMDDGQRSRVANAVDRNNSDIDFCEKDGRLVINYSWGNQLGVEHLAEALYDGSEAQFLRGWFPEK